MGRRAGGVLVIVIAASLFAAAGGPRSRGSARPESGSLEIHRTRGRCIGCAGPLRLGRIQFVTPTEGWSTAYHLPVVGQGLGVTAMVHTQDGGRTWVELPFVGEQFTGGAEPAFSFLDRERGWVAWMEGGGEGHLSETKDAGRRWRHRASPVSQGRIGALEILDRQRAWAVAAGLHGVSVALTADGGETWGVQPLPLASVDCACSLNRRTVWVLGPSVGAAADRRPRLGISADGGGSWRWSDLPPGYDEALQCEQVDAQTAWLIARPGHREGSDLLRTRDGGQTWSRQPIGSASPARRYFTALCFLSKTLGLAFADDPRRDSHAILLTMDGGETWRSQPADRSVSSCQAVAGEFYGAAGLDLLRIRPR